MNIPMPGELSEDVLQLQNEYLQERARGKGIVTLEDITTVKEQYGSNVAHADVISIWQGDITRLKVDTVKKWLGEHTGQMARVLFNVFKDEDRDIYKRIL